MCFHEDIDLDFLADTTEETARRSVEDFFRTNSDQVAQVRVELLELLSEAKSETELEKGVYALYCRWDFSPWRPWLQSLLSQIDTFMGTGGGNRPPSPLPTPLPPRPQPVLPKRARPGEAYNFRLTLLRSGLRKAAIRQVTNKPRKVLRRATMQFKNHGDKNMWLCEAICPGCGNAITLNLPDTRGYQVRLRDYKINCPHCKASVKYRSITTSLIRKPRAYFPFQLTKINSLPITVKFLAHFPARTPKPRLPPPVTAQNGYSGTTTGLFDSRRPT